jgi:DNA mismatch repair protein MutS
MYRGPGSGATALQKIGYYLSVPVTSYYDMAKTIGYAHNPYSYVNLWRGKKMADLAEIIAPDKAEAARLEEVNFEIGENVQNLLDQHLGPIPANFRGSMDEFEAKKAARISLGKKCAVGVGLATALYDALSVYQIYKTIGDLKVDHAIFTNMQTRLIGVARIVRGLHTLQELLQKYPTLQETVPSFKKITELFETGGEVGKLVQLLQTNTFAGEPSFFSNGVHILVAYKLMNEYKDSLSPALEAAGEFDAYTTLATCMSSPERGVYCYAQFIDNARPVIQLDGFWNPLMAPAKAVLNSVYFDQGHDKNMLLTGPNGSGKSTNMEAVCYNVLLMEVFGIAAARSACITPFDHINVYLAVQENIQEGQSTFMAEAQLLNKICAAVVASKPTERSFTIVDEGLRGTVAQEAEVRLTQAIETLVSVPQDLCIFATHLEQPTKLEAKLGGAISNYYVGLEEPTPGTFIRTFKMMRGVNSWWFADAEKRKRFIDWLLKNKTT